MLTNHRIFDRRRLLLLLCLLLTAGFLTTSLIGYQVSKQAIRTAIIDQELPLTSSNIYSEIQKDLVRPVLISSTMAHDTFLRNWVVRGEQDPAEIARYLQEIKLRYGAFSSFFVSDKTATYYTGEGILKHISATEPRDRWYQRVRAMTEPYEINVDPDLANKDALTIFINYRVFDFDGGFIGATGIGLTVDAVRHLIAEYQQRYQRTIYFVDQSGKVVLFGNQSGLAENLREAPGIGPLVDRILRERGGSYQFQARGSDHILNVSYLPDLKWHLFVEQNEAVALAGIRQTLYINLGISLLVTLCVLFLGNLALSRYQQRIEAMAATDKLTGLFNRQAFTILFDKLMAEFRRNKKSVSILLIDIDHFKQVNDYHGHRVGDRVLELVARLLRSSLRESDIAVRWGGEEFLLVLKECNLTEAQRIAENIRQLIAKAAIESQGQTVAVTVSIGVAEYDGRETPEQLVDHADAGLYRAKTEGRNRVHAMPRGLPLRPPR